MGVSLNSGSESSALRLLNGVGGSCREIINVQVGQVRAQSLDRADE